MPTLGYGPLDLGYTILNKAWWNPRQREKLHATKQAAEDARDMNRRKQEIELATSAEQQRQIETMREAAALNETAAINAEKRRKALEDESRERARQGIVTGRMEELNEQRRTTGMGLPQAAMGPVAEAFARSALQKADAAKTLGSTVESEISFGSLPRARSLQRTKVGTDEMGELSKQEDIRDKEALRKQMFKAKLGEIAADTAKFKAIEENGPLGAPGGAGLLANRERIAAELAADQRKQDLWDNLFNTPGSKADLPNNIPLDALFKDVKYDINTTPAQQPQPPLNDKGAPAGSATVPGIFEPEADDGLIKDVFNALQEKLKGMKFSRPEEIIPLPTPK